MAFEFLIYERKGQICYLTLNRPEKLNALNPGLMEELREALETIEVDPEIRVVILTGAGRAFSAGFDITREPGDPELHEIPPDIRRDQLKHHIDTFMMIWNLSKPVIAAVNGLALAGACELMQVCDIKIASENAILGEPEIRAGLGPPFLITPFSVSPMKAKELLLTGDTIDAQEALRLGMINRVVPQDQLMYECERTAKKICLMAQVGVKMTKRAVNRVMEGMGFLSTIEHNLELMVHFETSTSPEIDAFNEVRRESGLKAALNWRDDRFRDL